MSLPDDREPPREIWYSLEEALELLASLEDAHEVLVAARHLVLVLEVEAQIALLGGRLGFDEPSGDVDDD
jgi:hypothetical protein